MIQNIFINLIFFKVVKDFFDDKQRSRNIRNSINTGWLSYFFMMVGNKAERREYMTVSVQLV